MPCSPGEWFLDSSHPEKWTVYLWFPNGTSPTTADVEVKVRDLCYNMTKSSNLHLEGMDFHGCTLQLNNCNSSTVKNVDLLYPTFNREILEMGPVDEAEQKNREEHYANLDDQEQADEEGRTVARLQYWLGNRNVSPKKTISSHITVSTHRHLSASINLSFTSSNSFFLFPSLLMHGQLSLCFMWYSILQGHNNLVSNISLRYSNNHGLSIAGSNNVLEESLVYSTCWLGTLSYVPVGAYGDNNTVTRSTASYFGNAGITTHGVSVGDEQFFGAVLETFGCYCIEFSRILHAITTVTYVSMEITHVLNANPRPTYAVLALKCVRVRTGTFLTTQF